MKRYWKILSLCTLIVLIISTFYFQSVFAAKEDLTINFEKVRGDQTELDKLSFDVDYEKNNYYQPLKFTEGITVSLQNRSLLESLNRAYTNPEYKRLVEEFKGFMRGKVISTENYYEDEKVLAYTVVNPKSAMKFTFDIDVFHKEAGDNTAFKMDFPEKEKYNWVNVAKVQVFEGKLKVLVRAFKNGMSEMMLATIDLNKQEIEDMETILSTRENEHYWQDIRIIHDYSVNHKERYLLFNIEKQEKYYPSEETTTEHSTREIAMPELMIYDLENNGLQEVKIPEDMSGIWNEASIHGSVLYIPLKSENGLELYHYDIEKRVMGDNIKISLPSHMEDHFFEEAFFKIIKDRFYIVNKKKHGHTVLIGDIKTGEVFYEGVMKIKKNGQVQSDYRLYISNITILQ